MRRDFPNRTFAGPINGERRGSYHDLEMVVAVVLDPSDARLTVVKALRLERQDNRSNGGKPRQRLNEPEADSAASCSICALAPSDTRPTDGHLSDDRFLETFFAARPTSQRSDERTSEVARR